ncbi:MAG: CapA family protein, partial [Eubacteriales bacterium]|nr:CapA family protein [Eubacteriales bacterium]
MNNTEQVTAGKKVSRKHLLSLAVIAVLLGVFLFWGLHDGASKGEDNPKNTTEAAIEKVTPPTSLSIVCVGDVMVHRPQIASQYDSQSGTYDYNNNFRYIKRYIEEADLALCNVETTFAGGTPSGYPSFNAPDALAPALAATGFDIAITANNHMFDKG